jgi:hypothetical protein
MARSNWKRSGVSSRTLALQHIILLINRKHLLNIYSVSDPNTGDLYGNILGFLDSGSQLFVHLRIWIFYLEAKKSALHV